MAEEQRCREPHRLCANNCGFFGSPATNNLCSKCYRDFRLNEDQASSAKIAVEKSFQTPSSSSSTAVTDAAAAAAAASVRPDDVGPVEAVTSSPVSSNRCLSCRKKVGLTGFKCRCGFTYCGAHRYPEQHECSFDFKAVGREAIARANPVVRADKLDKI